MMQTRRLPEDEALKIVEAEAAAEERRAKEAEAQSTNDALLRHAEEVDAPKVEHRVAAARKAQVQHIPHRAVV